jgi:hypothetical protein
MLNCFQVLVSNPTCAATVWHVHTAISKQPGEGAGRWGGGIEDAVVPTGMLGGRS